MERRPAPDASGPDIPRVGSPGVDRRDFLAACIRSAILAGTCAVGLDRLGLEAAAQEPDPPEPSVQGRMVPPDWPEEDVCLVSEQPVPVTFADGVSTSLVVAIVRGGQDEPMVDLDRLRRVVRETCAGFDHGDLDDPDARATLEQSLAARLDDILKEHDASVDGITVVEVPGEDPPDEEDRSSGAPAPDAPERRERRDLEPDAPPEENPLPRPGGRCLIHGDEGCPAPDEER